MQLIYGQEYVPCERLNLLCSQVLECFTPFSNIKDAKCNDRFDKVHKTACACFTGENGKQEFQKEMKNTILSGNFEKKFKECHQQNGVPYPKEKVRVTEVSEP